MSYASRQSMAVIGGGLMGCGIAFVFAHSGYQARLFEPNIQQRETILNRIEDICNLLDVSTDLLGNIELSSSLEDAVSGVIAVIEAGPENLTVKQDIFMALGKHAPSECILATNTSAIPISKIAAQCNKKDRVIGTHFWNPPHLIELVEVILGADTDPKYADKMTTILSNIGMSPVRVNKDIPGFIGNRLQHALKREAIALVADGVCDARTLDTVVKLGFGARLPIMGPLEQSDLLGLKLTLAIHETLMPELDNTPEPHPFLREKIEKDEIGASVGQGFRDWTPEEADNARKDMNAYLFANAKRRYSKS